MRKVNHWYYIVQQGIDLNLTCALQAYLPDFKPAQNDFPTIQTAFLWTKDDKPIMVTSNGTKEVCELSLFYDPLKQSIKDGLRINCHGSLPVNKVLQDPHEGFYQCHAKLKIASAAEEIKQNQKIFLKVEANSALPTILAIVLVTILGTFLVIGAGLKLSGHQMTWQQKSVEPEVHFSRDYRFSESYPSPRNARHHSITSNMSGIVFNVSF